MSLLFFDSFKNYDFIPLKWEEDTRYSLFSIEPGVGRKNGAALTMTSAFTDRNYDHIGKYLNANYEELIVGFALKKVKLDAGHVKLIFLDGDNEQSSLRLFDHNFSWYKAGSTSNYGLGHSLQFNDWNYVEIKVKTHTVSGTLDVRINEHLAISLTNIDTAGYGTNYVNKIRLSCQQALATYEPYAYIEDLYIADTSGDVNNDFLGNCEVSLVYPISQGTHSEFSLPPTTSGVENYTLIDEHKHIQDDITTFSDNFFVYSAADDGSDWEQGGSNYFSNTSSYLPGGNYYINSSSSFTPTYWWYRFSSVSIPRNAKIISAYMYATVHSTSELNYPNDNEQRITAIKSGTPEGAIVPTALWQVHNMTNFCAAKVYSTIGVLLNDDTDTGLNIGSIIQELVDRHDWQEEDNKITLIVKHRYTNREENWIYLKYRGYSYYNDPFHAEAPRLRVNWQMPSGDRGEYIYSEQLGEKDTYNMSALPDVGDIFAISHSIFAKRQLDYANPNDMSFRSLIVVGDTTYSGIKALPEDVAYRGCYLIDEKNPATGAAWTNTDLVGAEFGFITTTSG
jgi:hypothetical protein